MLKTLFYQNECGESVHDRLARKKKKEDIAEKEISVSQTKAI
jgi:hypothetical protein